MWPGKPWPVPATDSLGEWGEQGAEMATTMTHLQLQDLLLKGSCLGFQSLPLLLLLPGGL